MRCELVALALAACGYTDPGRPIGLVPHELADDWVANLEEAGACWNLEFGTHYMLGEADQQVDVEFDSTTCLQAPAQVQPGMPATLGICPERYWPGLSGPYSIRLVTPFRIFSHELGHVVNMVGHPDDQYAVMRGGGDDFDPMFRPVDSERFRGANSDFTASSPCTQVTRSYRAGTGGTISHCACETHPLDVSRPIAIVVAPQLDPVWIDRLANAATCWNLRYGIDIVVRAPEPGDVIANVESCPDYTGIGRALDGDSVLTCLTYDGVPWYSAMYALQRVLGVPDNWSGGRTIFSDTADVAMASLYGRDVACHALVPGANNSCTCAD